MRAPRHEAVLLAAAAAMLLLAAATGCAGPSGPSAERVGEAVQPAREDLSTPESAVRSYLNWVSFSYRMANSDIPTATMTPEEGVRVDSYIQLNRTEGRGIEQSIEAFEVTGLTQTGQAAVLSARESWRYRYFSLDSLEYVSESLAASYDTTYTLVARPEGWLVDRVEATAAGEVR